MDQRKVFFESSERKDAFLEQENIASNNHQKLHFFKAVSPWFLSKKRDFLIFSFYAKWIKEKYFLKARKEKNLF